MSLNQANVGLRSSITIVKGAIQKICHAFFDQIWPPPSPLSQTVTHEFKSSYHKSSKSSYPLS